MECTKGVPPDQEVGASGQVQARPSRAMLGRSGPTFSVRAPPGALALVVTHRLHWLSA